MSYLEQIAARAGDEDSTVLIWEIDAAFSQAPPGSLSPRARELAELVRFCNFDAIAPWLRDERGAVERALAFARKHGEEEVARLLAEALAGTPPATPVFSVTLPGQAPTALDVGTPEGCMLDGKDYSGTDIALSFAMDGFIDTVLREVIAARAEIVLEPSRAVRQRARADTDIEDEASDATAEALFRKLVGARSPRVLAGAWDDFEERKTKDAKAVPVEHIAHAAAEARTLEALGKKYGAIASEILAVYGVHDGADLFVVEGEPGFILAPTEYWDEMLGRAVEWAESVTWQDEPEEIPKYLYTAIGFGMIPGDSERWLFVTEGPHAGKVMLSDTDLIEDEPRFESLAEFFATLLRDPARILNSGGHVRYRGADEDNPLFPIAYRFD